MERNYHKSIIDRFGHRRLVLFWAAALIFLSLPWLLKGCGRAVIQMNRSLDVCPVLSIHDGDTMTVQCDGRKVRVRLYCIDAPEMGQKPWGSLSRNHLRSITASSVRLVVHGRDRYGRVIAEIFNTGENQRNLNIDQVGAGEAAIYEKYCTSTKYKDVEDQARVNEIGIWRMEGLHQSPWEWRATR